MKNISYFNVCEAQSQATSSLFLSRWLQRQLIGYGFLYCILLQDFFGVLSPVNSDGQLNSDSDFDCFIF